MSQIRSSTLLDAPKSSGSVLMWLSTREHDVYAVVDDAWKHLGSSPDASRGLSAFGGVLSLPGAWREQCGVPDDVESNV
jgi:hypothetical protein